MPATISPHSKGAGPSAAEREVSDSSADRPLIALLVAGDERGLELVHLRYGDLVQRTALRILGDPQTAEEVTQDVFLSAWRARGRLSSGYPSLRPWLLTTTRHRCVDRMRRRRLVTQELEAALNGAPAAHDTVFDEVWVAGQRLSVQLAVTGLSPCQAQVVWLVHLHGYSGPQAALVLGVPVSTVKGRLRLALASLAKALGPATEQTGVAA